MPAGTPTITTQPSDLTVVVGQPATFTVDASGPNPLTYQWSYSSDGTTFTPINGATGSSYTINSTALSDAGYYRVTIYSPSASITSNAAKLTVYKGTVTITASSATIAYGEAIPAITPSYAGFVGGDTPEIALTSLPTCGTTATSSSPPDTYPTTCSGAASSTYALKYVDGTLTITQGTVTITSDSANSQPKSVASTGGTASFTLKATLTDGQGDITTALPVSYTLTPIGPGSTYTCTDSTGGGVTDGVLSSSCAFTGVAPNVYTLTISVASTNFSGSTTDTVTVIDPGLAFATGSGTVSHGGMSGKFLLTAEYKKGTLTGTFRFDQGNIQLTSSSLTSLAVVLNGPNGPIAYVSGTATDQQGNHYTFRVTAINGGLPPAQNQLGLSVTDSAGQPVPDLTFDPVRLSCGTIVIGSPTNLAAHILGFTTGLFGWQNCR